MPNLFKNLWTKLAALLLAFLLWFHVATDKTFQYEANLKLTQIELVDEISLSAPPPDEFKIIVSATGKRLLRSDWKKAGLRLMVDRNRPGRAKITFDKNNLSLMKADDIELINIISPRDVVLEFDRKIQKKVPIRSTLTIIPDQGFIRNKDDSLVPYQVTITGPRKLLNTIDSIETVSEYVEGIRNNLSMRVPLVYPDIYGLEIFPDTVSYFVNVTPIKSRVFSDIIIQLINGPSQSDSVVSIQPNNLEIRVGGIPAVIDSLKPEMFFATVDYQQFDSLGYAPIKITLPKTISIISQSTDSIKLIRQ